MEPRIEVIAPKKLIGMRLQMSYADDRTAQLWQGFRRRVDEIAERFGSDFISMQLFTPPQPLIMAPIETFEKWAVVAVSSHARIPVQMEAFDLPAGKYAVFIHRGPASAAPRTFGHIFGEWLPRSGYRLANRPHFEVLSADYRPMDPHAQEEVWIPIE